MNQKRKNSIFYLLAALGLISITLSGCSAGSNGSSEASNEVTISGTISNSVSSQSSSKGLRIAGENDLSNYKIWFQNQGSKRVYFADIDESGGFDITLETNSETLGKDFIGLLIQEDPLEIAGVLMMDEDTEAGEASTGLKVLDNTEGLAFAFDSASKKMIYAPEEGSNVIANSDLKARLDENGEAVGIDNSGKASKSQTSSLNSSNPLDKDQDGVPDMFDAMNNGQDLDNAVGGTTRDGCISSDILNSAIMFMNLKVDESIEDTFTVTDNALVVLEVSPKKANKISSVKALLVHTNYQTATLDKVFNGWTSLDTYPGEGSNWADDGFKLYKMQNGGGQTVWTVPIRPGNNSFEPGNLVLLEVTLTDSSKEYYWTSINFKFESILDSTTTWSHGGEGSRETPYIILDTGGRVFSWTAPKDETGTDLTGLQYQFELFFYDENDNQVGDRQVIDIGEDVYTGQIPEATIDMYNSESTPPQYIQVDITARYPYGDNSANKIYMKRDSW